MSWWTSSTPWTCVGQSKLLIQVWQEENNLLVEPFFWGNTTVKHIILSFDKNRHGILVKPRRPIDKRYIISSRIDFFQQALIFLGWYKSFPISWDFQLFLESEIKEDKLKFTTWETYNWYISKYVYAIRMSAACLRFIVNFVQKSLTLKASIILRNSILWKNKLRVCNNCNLQVSSWISFHHQQILKLKYVVSFCSSLHLIFCWQFSAAVCLYNNAKTQRLSAISMTSILGTQEEKNQTTTTSGLIEKKWYTQTL